MAIDTSCSSTRSTERKFMLSNLRPVSFETNCVPVLVRSGDVSGIDAQTEGNDNWNIAEILCVDGELGLTCGSYFSSSSIDDALSGFRSLIWDSFTISWARKMHQHFIYWQYRAVTRDARLLCRQSERPARPNVSIEGYPKHAAPFLVKEALKSWHLENTGFCTLIGDPGARAPYLQTTKYYIRCFGETRFRNSGGSCVIDAAYNAGYLFLGGSKGLSISERFVEVARRASQCCLPDDEGKSEIIHFWSVDHLGPVLKGFGDDLKFQTVKNIPPHGHGEVTEVRFIWLFDKRIQDHIFRARLYEADAL